MPTLFGHAILGASAAQLTKSVKSPRRLYFFSLLVSVIPDFDGITFILGVPYDSFLGHRGFFHSIIFSAFAGWIAAGLYNRSFKLKTLQDCRWVLYFFLIILSHPLLDSMTQGGHGVALFAPFDNHRYFHVFRPIHVSPLSISEFFNLGGARVLFNEIWVLAIPSSIWILLAKLTSRDSVVRVFHLLLPIALMGFFLGVIREERVPLSNGTNIYRIGPLLPDQNKHGLSELPTDTLPGKRLILNYDEMNKNHLLNTLLIPNQIPWAGISYPYWLGGAAGRWQESYAQQIWTSLWSESFLSKPKILDLLHHQSTDLLRFSPTEKYDLAVGDYYLGATRAESSVRGRGYLNSAPNTPAWVGYCHSIGLASLFEKEPKKDVKIQNADGYEITFYPNDVKALLGIAYLFLSKPHWDLGNRCQLDGPKSEDCLDINPASLVIALTNLIGLGKTSFLVAKEPFNWINNSPIRKAEVRILNSPYFPADRSTYFDVDELFIKALVDVEIRMTVSKITSFLRGDGESDEEDLSYRATLGLDAHMNLVGGRWEDPFHHPDFVWGSSTLQNEPALFGPFTKANVKIEWPILKAIVNESTSLTPQSKPLLISGVDYSLAQHGFGFSSEADGVLGRISYTSYGDPIEIYGQVTSVDTIPLTEVELIVDGTIQKSQLSSKIFSNGHEKPQFFHFRASGSLMDKQEVRLRFTKDNAKVDFLLPPKRKFESQLSPEP